MKNQANRTSQKSIQHSRTLRWLTPIVLVSALVACGDREDNVVADRTVDNDSVQNPSSPQQTTQRTVDPGTTLPVTGGRAVTGAGSASGTAPGSTSANPGNMPSSSTALTTSDAAPTVTASTPANRDDMVMTDTDEITVTFSKAMDPMSITAANLSLACPAGAQQEASVEYAPRGNIATLTLPDSLPPRSICVVTIGTGVKDMNGTAMTAPHSWTFTTGSDATATPLSTL